MNLKRLFSKPAYWTLAVGFATGAVAMASVLSSRVTPSALAGPDVKVSAKAVGDLSTTEMEALRTLDSSFASLADYVAPSVVHIKSESKSSTDVMGRMMPSAGQGSGVIFRPDGYIVTNDHVVGGFDKVTVILHDGREFEGKVTRASDSDIAVVKINAKDLVAARFGDSDKVKIGQFAIAVGSPFGLENSVTVGHISGLGRHSSIDDYRLNQRRVYPDLLQTDASINMGNSGGPLLNIEGEIVGINTAIYSETGASNGVGFAIPGNQARLIAEMLVEKGKIVRGFIGVRPLNLKPYQKKEMGVSSGALIQDVESDAPAAMAGLKKNDVIVRIGTYPITSQVDLRNTMLRYGPGESVPVEYIRGTERKTVNVKLGTPPQPQSLMPDLKDAPKVATPFEFDGMKDPEIRKFFEGPDTKIKREGKARLGVAVEDIDTAKRKQYHIPEDVKGAVIVSIDKGSVAEKLGLKIGDVIEQLGDQEIESASDVSNAMRDVNWGDTRIVKVSRYRANGRTSQAQTVTFK
jgi:serine protease Do